MLVIEVIFKSFVNLLKIGLENTGKIKRIEDQSFFSDGNVQARKSVSNGVG